MSRINRAGPIFRSLCSSTRPTDPRIHSCTPSSHLYRSFSFSSHHVKWYAGPTVRDPVTGIDRRRTPYAPPPSAQEKDDAATCRRAIEEGELPETIFRSRSHAGILTRAEAAVCVMEVSQRRHSETKLGQNALAWIWDQRGDLIYPDDNDLVYAMVDLLLREGQEEEIWRWMSCDSTRPKYAPDFIRFEWRDTALKGLILAKAKLTTNRSFDDAIKDFLRSKNFNDPSDGVTCWLLYQLTRWERLRVHEMSPSVNGGRCWEHLWSNTSIELWEEAIKVLSPIYQLDPARLAKVAMFHLRKPNPEPLGTLFRDALANPDNVLRKMKSEKTRAAWRNHGGHAADELRRLGRYDDAAELDAARHEVFPLPQEYGDRPDREGIFAQGRSAKKLPFPKFK